MENNKKIPDVLDLLLRAAKNTPKVTYCKSSKYEFSYERFVFACIKLAKEIEKKKQISLSKFIADSFI